MSNLVVSSNIKKYNKVYDGGYDKQYPNLDLVRLQGWYFNNQPGRVLDYGAGTGVNGIHLLKRGYDLVFIDASPRSVALIENKLEALSLDDGRAEALLLDPEMERLPLEDGCLDYVVCMSVLSLLETKGRIQTLVSEFHRVLRSGGKMIIDVNGPESDFATKGQFINDDTFEYALHDDNETPIRCYCPKTKENFAELFGAFNVDELGSVSFQYCGHDSHEFIALAHKV